MLVRAARGHGRQHGTRCFKVACKQVHPPWLSPAYAQCNGLLNRSFTLDTGSQGPSLRKRRDSRDGTSSTPRRSLATAVDVRPYANEVPFDNLTQHPIGAIFDPRLPGPIPAVPNIASFDPTRTLVLKGDTTAAPHRIRYYKGIGGDLEDIISILHACLRVGRLERARVILRRISSLQILSPEEMIDLHNDYINASMLKLIERSSNNAAQELHKWFELEIRSKALPITAETVTYMLRAALHNPPGPRRDRLVRRYMDMGGLEVLGLMEAEEQAHITSIVQDFNYPTAEPDPVDDVEQLEEYSGITTKTAVAQVLGPIAIPPVLPVEIKGLGLKTLKQALSLFSTKSSDFNADELDQNQRRQRQEQLERDAVTSAIDRWREDSAQLTKVGIDTTLETKSLGSRMWKWQCVLETYIKEELVKVELAESVTESRSIADNDRCSYGPFLRLLSPERLAAVTILSTMTNLSGHGASRGLPLSSGIMAIGSSVEDESATMVIQKRYGKDVWKNLGRTKLGGVSRMMKRKQYQQVADSLSKTAQFPGFNASATENKWGPQWSTNVRGRVGAFLMSALIECAKIPVKKVHPETGEEVVQMQPAFSHAYQYKLGKKQGVVLANAALIAQLNREPVHSLLAKHLPMLAEPEPWSQFNVGGFLVHPAKVMRIKLGDKDQRHYAEAAIGKGDMEQMFKGLGVLGKTSWRVNREVFDTMLEAWNSGIAIANFPPAEPDLPIPPEPEPSQDPSVRRQWMNAVKNVESIRSGYHSQRCFQNFQLEIARALRDEIFYFPHNIDFRGRAYPIPPYLNHMGADHCRGLLKFGNGKELGENGLKWLKIHLANVYGYDKASLLEREKFSVDHLEDIYDSANSPLVGKRWWLKAEDPWQCLAACFELRNALQSGDPTRFVSHLPIHQDGTCNGLQHYAALGGDEWGAKQVNLIPGDRPADVYSAVADLVKQSLARDLEHGNRFAKILDGKITRKVVKQTVMTNVYGVTFIGARAQVRRQLEAAYPDLPNTPTLHPGLLSSYIATKIFKALSSMFSGAHDIQYWLGECASRISQVVAPEQVDLVRQHLSADDGVAKKGKGTKKPAFSVEEHLQFKSSVIWTNPLRMPVVQPYRTSKTRTISTNLQRVNLSDPHASDPVSKRKQLQGFPPNFVHSLDASHMILSALKCDELGLTFAAVHDSFWTHATDIEAMNGVLRDAFINIHSEDVIGRLAAEFNARYKGGLYLAKIKPESRLGQKIQQYRKGRAYQKILKDQLSSLAPVRDIRTKELLIERHRISLLESSNPEEVEKGRKMVTAGSIFEELSADEDLAPSEDIESLALGQIPQSESTSKLAESEQVDMTSLDDIQNTLPGGTAADIALSDDDMVLDETFKLRQKNPFEAKILGSSSKKQATWQWAWLPFRLPPVPKKV